MTSKDAVSHNVGDSQDDEFREYDTLTVLINADESQLAGSRA